jgi:hypothetical protein
MPLLEFVEPSDLRRTFKAREADSEDREKAASQSGSSTSVEAAETDTRVTAGLVMGSVASAQPEGACRSSTTVPDAVAAVAACAPPAPGGIPSDFGAESEVSSHSLASSEESSLPIEVHEKQEVDEGGSSKGDSGNAATESEDDSEESRASDSPRCSEEGSEMPARNPWKSFLDLAS